MTEAQRRCPQCGDPVKPRHILDGTLTLDDVTEMPIPSPAWLIIRKTDAEYLEVQLWRCPICGHIELVAKEAEA